VGETQHLREIERVSTKFHGSGCWTIHETAVEMAVWDIVGKRSGKPVWQIAGSRGRELRVRTLALAGTLGGSRSPLLSVPTKCPFPGVEPAKAAEIAKWAVAQGFSKMKVKVGIDPREDVAASGRS